MKIILSYDVSNYIFIFLFFSSSFEKLFCLSKLTTKTLKNTIEYKTFTKYNEIFEMMREDKSSFITDLSYEKIWFKYYKYRWPPLIKEDIGTNHELCEYKIGDFVDAKDFMNAWCPAKIININFKRKYVFTKGNNLIVENGEKIYEVEFLGWSTSFNEKIDYIVYEDEFPYSQKSKKIRKILAMHNYVLIGRLTWLDQIYKKKIR